LIQNQHRASIAVDEAAVVEKQRPTRRIDECRNAINPLTESLLVRLDVAGAILPPRRWKRSNAAPDFRSPARAGNNPWQRTGQNFLRCAKSNGMTALSAWLCRHSERASSRREMHGLDQCVSKTSCKS